MSYQAGDTYPWTVTIRDATGALTDPESLIVNVRDPSGTITTYVYGTDAIIVRDSEGEYHADIPLTAPGMWVIEAATSNEAQVEGVQFYAAPAPTAAITFATVDELALRLGTTLTDTQAATGRMLLEMATGLIIEAVDKTDAWAATLDPIPRYLRAVCLEAVARVSQNPAGVSSESETLGAYSRTSRYEFHRGADQPSGLVLTDIEERLCRRAVWGSNTAGARTPPRVLEDVISLWENGDIAS